MCLSSMPLFLYITKTNRNPKIIGAFCCKLIWGVVILKHMQLVTIPKTEYRKILQNQEELRSEVSALRRALLNDENSWELKPFVKRRLDRLSQELDKGGGRRFKNANEFSKHLNNL